MSDYTPKRLIIDVADLMKLTGRSASQCRNIYNLFLEMAGKKPATRQISTVNGRIAYERGQKLTVFDYARLEGADLKEVCLVLGI